MSFRKREKLLLKRLICMLRLLVMNDPTQNNVGDVLPVQDE
jgi:hypothetical protein